MAGPAAGRQDPCSFSQHAPPPPQPPRPRCLPAPGSRQGSVHGLRQGATVQGSGCGLPAHSGTMERHVGWSWGAAGGIGTGAGETTPGAGGRSREERLWVFLGRSCIPQGPRSEISFRCVGGQGHCGTWDSRYKRWGQGHAFLGAKDPCQKVPAPAWEWGPLGVGRKEAQWGSPLKCVCVQFGSQETKYKGTGGSPLPPPHVGHNGVSKHQNTLIRRTDTVCS